MFISNTLFVRYVIVLSLYLTKLRTEGKLRIANADSFCFARYDNIDLVVSCSASSLDVPVSGYASNVSTIYLKSIFDLFNSALRRPLYSVKVLRMLLCQSIFSFKLVTGLVVYVYPLRYTGFGISDILYVFAWYSVGFTLSPGLIAPTRAALYVSASSGVTLLPSVLAPVSAALYAAASSGVTLLPLTLAPGSAALYAAASSGVTLLPSTLAPGSVALYAAACASSGVIFVVS